MKLIIKYADAENIDEQFVHLYNVNSVDDAHNIVVDLEQSKNFIVILGHVVLTEEELQVIANQGKENITFLN